MLAHLYENLLVRISVSNFEKVFDMLLVKCLMNVNDTIAKNNYW
jgi:hypothetical protein